MTAPDDQHPGRRLRTDPAELRPRLAAVAVAIASTEDRVADTLERMALTRPYDAAGLRARAAQARHNALQERNRAAALRQPRRSRDLRSRTVVAEEPALTLDGLSWPLHRLDVHDCRQ